jgi:cytochrome d ubiquinol oxidase subunit II
VVTGLATVLLYTTEGAAYLRFKSDGALRETAAVIGRVTLGFTAVFALVAALSLDATATPVHAHSAARITLVTVAVVIAVGGFLFAGRGFGHGWDGRALTGVVIAETAGLLALITVIAPVLVPPGITIHNARSPGLTFLLLLIGIGANIPLVLFYSWYAHHVFRGKYRVADSDRPTGVSAAAHAILSGPTREAA